MLIQQRAATLGVDISAAPDPQPARPGPARALRAASTPQRRPTRASTVETARDIVVDVSYFGTMMVELGLADGMVSGAVHTTPTRSGRRCEVVRTVPGVSVVSSVFFMCLRRPGAGLRRLRGQPRPDRRAARRHRHRLRRARRRRSASSRGSRCCPTPPAPPAPAPTSRRSARRPRWCASARRSCSVEGPIQYDAAIDAAVARTKLPDSEVAGRATVFVFPDLNTGNNTYKAVQRSRPARSRSARSCRGCASRSTTCRAGRPCATSSTPWRSPRSRRRLQLVATRAA